jgi:trehalose 6-phosphate synthase
MRLSLRFIVPLLAVLAALAYAVVPLVDKLTLQWFVRDLDSRASAVATTMQEPLKTMIDGGNRRGILALFAQVTKDERLYALGFCAAPDSTPLATTTLPRHITCRGLDTLAGPTGRLLESSTGPVLASVRPLVTAKAPAGRLVLVHDMSFIVRRSAQTRKYLFLFFVALAAVVALITVAVAQLSWRGWVQGLNALLRGEGLLRPEKPYAPELRPIARDLRTMIRDLVQQRGTQDDEQIAWTPDALRGILRGELKGEEVIVVSNREPYIHQYVDGGIEVWRPASGLVTALEPVMRACAGIWVAHGGGSADRAVVDRHDRVAVPPEQPAYRLRRVWLSEEEEAGYYYGFANEGLWPLCHIAHVRPTFRTSDWGRYGEVNHRFAETVAAEATSDNPIVLVQDYHFALLPRMIREALPAATVVSFWHIPWPNPEAFSICPWRDELLTGLLGSDILGFHTRFHCINFLDTVDRFLEARVDRETFTVTYQGKVTAVKRYPISIDFPPAPSLVAKPVDECRLDVRARHDLPPDHAIGIGVDRLDYTKGIEERFRAVERLLELEPDWVGGFSFIQVAAPTRGRIAEYQAYEARVRAMADAINARFPGVKHPPIILHVAHHEAAQVYEYYRAADVCVVTSLHDGMNLVAKEFVSSRDDERGVLVLSQFAGASRDLPEAIIVNPYDIDQCAAALQLALAMPVGEQRARMRLMRGLVRDFNVYRWAGRMLIDAAGMRRRGRLIEWSAEPEWRVRDPAGERVR